MQKVECWHCNGTGKKECDRCGGIGSLPGFSTFGGGFTSCDVCLGDGYVVCEECNGDGYKEEWIDSNQDIEFDDSQFNDEEYSLINLSFGEKYSYILKYAKQGKPLAQYDLGIMILSEGEWIDEIPQHTYSFEDYYSDSLYEEIATEAFQEFKNDIYYDEMTLEWLQDYCSDNSLDIDIAEEIMDEYEEFKEAEKDEYFLEMATVWITKAAGQGLREAQSKLIDIVR